MKKLIFIISILVLVIVSCNRPAKEARACKFYKGEEVLLKPTDVKAIIKYNINCGTTGEHYAISYFDDFGKMQEETYIYSHQMKKNNIWQLTFTKE